MSAPAGSRWRAAIRTQAPPILRALRLASSYIGAMYESGPRMVAGGYSNNDFNDTDVVAGWGAYRFAPGVMATAGIEYADDST